MGSNHSLELFKIQFEVVGAVNLKLAFTDWFFYDLIVLIKLPISKLRQGSIISEKPGNFSEKLKIWQAPTTTDFKYFLLKFCTHFLLNNL